MSNNNKDTRTGLPLSSVQEQDDSEYIDSSSVSSLSSGLCDDSDEDVELKHTNFVTWERFEDLYQRVAVLEGKLAALQPNIKETCPL